MPAEALHLDDVREADPPQHAAKAFLGLEPGEFVKCGENALQILRGPGFLEEQLGATAQTFGAMLFGRKAGEDDFGEIGVLAMDEVEELHAIDDRHLDVEHDQVHRLILENREGFPGGLGEVRFPQLALGAFDDGGDGLKERRFVIDEQDTFSLGTGGSHCGSSS